MLPEYKEKSREGAVHAPHFEVECQLKSPSRSFVGSGRSLKMARDGSCTTCLGAPAVHGRSMNSHEPPKIKQGDTHFGICGGLGPAQCRQINSCQSTGRHQGQHSLSEASNHPTSRAGSGNPWALSSRVRGHARRPQRWHKGIEQNHGAERAGCA